jgi:hypothetical protein
MVVMVNHPRPSLMTLVRWSGQWGLLTHIDATSAITSQLPGG